MREKVSKRIIGATAITLAMLMGVSLFWLSIDHKISDPEVAKYVVSTFFLAGLTLLGIDTGGRMFKNERKDNQ